MTIYYVATLARYVLVEADNEAEARGKAVAAFAHRWADIQTMPRITTVRPATDAEIELGQWHDDMRGSEQGQVAACHASSSPSRPGHAGVFLLATIVAHEATCRALAAGDASLVHQRTQPQKSRGGRKSCPGDGR